MASVFDVAKFILERVGQTSTWKLQKLVYYSQAWHSVWEDKALFNSRIEAWAAGPVCVELYDMHKGQFSISDIPNGSSDRLSMDEKSSIVAVVEAYNRFNGQQLSELTHQERPWMDARRGLAPGQRGCNEITVEAMAEFYASF